MLDLIRALDLHLEPSAPDVVAFVGSGGKTSGMRQTAAAIVRAKKRVVITTTTNIGPEQKALFPAVIEQTDDHLPLDLLAELLEAHGQCLIVGPTAPAKRGHKVKGVPPEFVDRLVKSAAEQAEHLQIAAFVLEADGSRRLPIKAPAEYEPPMPNSTTHLVSMVGLDAVGRLIEEGAVHRPERIRSILGIAAKRDDARLTPAHIAALLRHPQGGAKALPPGARLFLALNKADASTHRVLARLIANQLSISGSSSLITTLNPNAFASDVDAPDAKASCSTVAGLDIAKPVLERWGSIATVILAAGQSRRMGRAKQLEVVDGEAMVVRAARVALQSASGPIIIVTGAYAEEIEQALALFHCQAQEQRLHLVHNPDWAEGQSTSVRCAISAMNAEDPTKICSEISAAIMMPVDQPFLQPALLRNLQRLWRHGAAIAAPTVDGQPRGAPAIFDRTLWPELLALTGDVGARHVLQKYRFALQTVAVSAEQLRDIDSPEDLSKYTRV